MPCAFLNSSFNACRDRGCRDCHAWRGCRDDLLLRENRVCRGRRDDQRESHDGRGGHDDHGVRVRKVPAWCSAMPCRLKFHT